MDFIVRIYQGESSWLLGEIQEITISNITLVSKTQKYGGVCLHKGNQKKFKYSIELSKTFNKVSGSHSYPNLTFKGKYIDIKVKNFPRFPCFAQCKYAARNILNGYSGDNSFPKYLNHRKIEIRELKPTSS